MPALRNYSDAAKEPVAHPYERVVTHPEELRTKNNDAGVTDSLQLRMYAYCTNAREAATPDRMTDPMVVEIVGMNLTDSTSPTKLDASVTLQNIPGGVSVGGSSDYSVTWLAAQHATDSPASGEMYYTAEFVDPGGTAERFTRIYLFNTPLVAPPVTQSGLVYGLANTEQARLYWMPYIPSPVKAPSGVPSFDTMDLTKTGTGPKNTARWTARINPSVLTIRRLLFEAGDDVESLMILCRADVTSKNNDKVAKYLRNFEQVEKKMIDLEKRDKVRNFQPPISGEEIIKLFNLVPGPLIGEIKEEIKEAILDGIIHNDRNEAYELLLRIANRKGLNHEVNQ